MPGPAPASAAAQRQAQQLRAGSGRVATTSGAPGAARAPRRLRFTAAAAPAAATATTAAPPRPEWAPVVTYTVDPAAVPQAPQAPAWRDLPPALRGVDFFAPPLADDPLPLLKARVPFLTRAAGALPAVPESLDHALYRYGE